MPETVITTAEKLIERAQKGERLTTKQRRLCIAYMIGLNALETNQAMADLFQISERQVRADKLICRTDKAKSVRDEDIGLVIADLTIAFENELRDLQRSKKKCKLGSRTFLEHSKALFNLQLAKIKAFQDLGLLSKNIGQMTVERFDYRAVVSQDGSVVTRPVDLIIDAEVEERRPTEQKALLAAGHDKDREPEDR